MIVDFNETYFTKKIFIVGDIHGRYRDFLESIYNKPEYLDSTIIFMGDAFVGFQPEFENTQLWPVWNKYCKRKNMYMMLLRGNHDNPNWFDGTHDLERIKFLPDYSVLKFEEEHILVLGGAISINRTKECRSRFWWPNEVFHYDEKKLKEIRENYKIDIVLSHTVPNFCHPVGMGNIVQSWLKVDTTLREDLINERQQMTDLYHYLSEEYRPKKWYYGHMHTSSYYNHYNTYFTALEEMEIIQICERF